METRGGGQRIRTLGDEGRRTDTKTGEEEWRSRTSGDEGRGIED